MSHAHYRAYDDGGDLRRTDEMARHLPSTPEQVAARDAARRAEAEKMDDFYNRQERAREEREAAEARAAQEGDIERRRQAGWG